MYVQLWNLVYVFRLHGLCGLRELGVLRVTLRGLCVLREPCIFIVCGLRIFTLVC